MGNVKSYVSRKSTTKNSSTEPTKGEPILIGSDIRCPNNHTCTENTTERKNNVCQIIGAKELTCKSCSNSLEQLQGSFYSCVMCNYDVCSECIKNQRESTMNSYSGPTSVEFVDNKDRQIRITMENSQVFFCMDKQPKEAITTFTLAPHGRWRGPVSSGMLDSKKYKVPKLRRKIDEMLMYANELRELNKEFEKPTCVHNPGYEFMQPSTLSQLILHDEDFECPTEVANLIASFVVERKIKVSVNLFSDKLRFNDKITIPIGAHKTMGDLAQEIDKKHFRQNPSYSMMAMYVLQDDVETDKVGYSENVEEDALFELYDDDELYFGGKPSPFGRNDAAYFKNHTEKMPAGKALIGDIFGLNGKSIAIQQRYSPPRVGRNLRVA